MAESIERNMPGSWGGMGILFWKRKSLKVINEDFSIQCQEGKFAKISLMTCSGTCRWFHSKCPSISLIFRTWPNFTFFFFFLGKSVRLHLVVLRTYSCCCWGVTLDHLCHQDQTRVGSKQGKQAPDTYMIFIAFNLISSCSHSGIGNSGFPVLPWAAMVLYTFPLPFRTPCTSSQLSETVTSSHYPNRSHRIHLLND